MTADVEGYGTNRARCRSLLALHPLPLAHGHEMIRRRGRNSRVASEVLSARANQ